jgi:hypothetical protein
MSSNLDYFNQKLNEIPKDVLSKAVEFLKFSITEEDKDLIREKIDREGLVEWCYNIHHNWGMNIRNALRSEAGLSDSLLPDKNWDDYYIQCVEIAVGKREMYINTNSKSIIGCRITYANDSEKQKNKDKELSVEERKLCCWLK